MVGVVGAEWVGVVLVLRVEMLPQEDALLSKDAWPDVFKFCLKLR